MGNRTWTGGMRGARGRLSIVGRGNSQQVFCHNIGNKQPFKFPKELFMNSYST